MTAGIAAAALVVLWAAWQGWRVWRGRLVARAAPLDRDRPGRSEPPGA